MDYKIHFLNTSIIIKLILFLAVFNILSITKSSIIVRYTIFINKNPTAAFTRT